MVWCTCKSKIVAPEPGAEQGAKARSESWSVLEEITGKAAAVAIEVEGRFVSVQDTRQCHLMASACHIALNTYMSTQAAGLGVGATTFQGSGGKPDQIGWTEEPEGQTRAHHSASGLRGTQRTPRAGPRSEAPLYRGPGQRGAARLERARGVRGVKDALSPPLI